MTELKYTQLKKTCAKKELTFKTTSDAEACPDAIGQGKAVEALEFGLSIREKGYNIFVSGQPGSGRTSISARYAEKQAKTMPAPPDLCYIYNFDEPRYPRHLALNPGTGRALKKDMETFSDGLAENLPRMFTEKDFEDKKHAIVKSYQDKRDEVIRQITIEAKESDYGVKMTQTGIYFMPIIDGEMISEEQYNALSQEERDSISERTEVIQVRASEVMREIKEFERLTQNEVGDLEKALAESVLDGLMKGLLETYADNELITKYLEQVRKDVMDNLAEFAEEDGEDEGYIQSLMPWASRREKSDLLSKYKVNLLTDNSGNTGAPVITDYNPTYVNLIGEVEYDSEFGNLTTDFMKIKPGLLHKANGGFLILQARDVLSNVFVWEAMCKTLLTGKAVIEPMREYATGIAMAGLRPEPADIDVKIILVGSEYMYEILEEFDEEFGKLFKINALFDYEMAYGSDNIKHVAGFIKRFTEKRNSAPFDAAAVAIIVEHMGRLAESQDKLTTQFGVLTDILTESTACAGQSASVKKEHVERAIKEREKRTGLYEEKLNELIERDIIMIDTDGSKTAQINGLAVLEAVGRPFGKPARITATTYVGKAGIVNIEKEAEMSGSIHDKGVQVIIGYLGQTYAQRFPLSLSCRICFEQNYSGIDGDSASSAELYTILSSLAELPLRQDIAVTGSINQRGEIQPIGGVTYKIEGFFALCKSRGLTGKQGVVIPDKNVKDLALNDDVIKAVNDGVFHIYAIGNINEGIEIMTGITAGETVQGKYPPESVHGMVYKKLKRFYKFSQGE